MSFRRLRFGAPLALSLVAGLGTAACGGGSGGSSGSGGPSGTGGTGGTGGSASSSGTSDTDAGPHGGGLPPDNDASPGSGGADGGAGAAPCLDNDTFFVRKAWREVLRPMCSTCHSANGAAAQTRMVYVPEGAPDWQRKNLAAFRGVAELAQDGVPLVLLKPSGDVVHAGGALLPADAPARATVAEMVTRLAHPEDYTCENSGAVASNWAGVTLQSPAETLRKFTLFFGARLPRPDELALVDTAGEAGLEPALDAVLYEDAFYEWLRITANDLLLTDRYLGNRRAVDAIGDDTYTDLRWFLQDDVNPGTGQDAAWFHAAQQFTNDALAREPVELIVHLVRENRPITEMLTADYTVVNPFSARAYGVQEQVHFDDRFDARTFLPAHVPGVPHAGVLTSPIFLTRFPTTDTNRNRARARVIYKNFLATNVLELAQRPVVAISPIHNPTLNDPQCNVCHSVLDPLAGTLQSWDARGGYAPLEAWYPEMAPPGFAGEMLPADQRDRASAWLAERLVQDRRFDQAIVRWMFKAIVGSAVRAEPRAPEPGVEPTPEYTAALLAFEAQADELSRLERELRANGHDLRRLIKAIVRSPYFRAETMADPGASIPAVAALPDVGTGRLLPPEHLARHIQATTGLPWRPRPDQTDFLLDANQYKLIYGGLDSEDVIERATEPNPLMGAIQARMATDMACLVVTQEFAHPAEQRRLLGGVEPSFRPRDENGFDVPQGRAAIRETLRNLHWAILGERLTDDSPELERTYQLFVDVWQANVDALAAQTLPTYLPDACRANRDYRTGIDFPEAQKIQQDPTGTIRAWQAVMVHLLSDFRFFHE